MVNQIIVQKILAYVNQEGSTYDKWYCGIASDPDKRLLMIIKFLEIILGGYTCLRRQN